MVRLVALGGLGEVGMNCLALSQRDETILVDCGVLFGDRELGVDVIHPDFSALAALPPLRGVALTHGHEDHIGALPYLLARHDVPVHGPAYALELVRERARDHEILAHARLVETRPRTPYRIGSFEIEPVRVTHSMVDATSLAIRTDEGLVVHTGDFKIDETPPDDEHFDADRFRALGDEGVALLLSDSTNSDAEGPTGSEATVAPPIERIVRETTGAVVVSIFASNLHRMRLLGEIAARSGRRLVLLGRGVGTHARVGRALGRLPWPDALVWPEKRVGELPKEKVLAIATGAQGEPNAALARLSRGEVPGLDLGDGDAVVLSARAIPGNERDVVDRVDALARRGVRVCSRVTDRALHVSGHAHRPEQREMIRLVRPRAFVPVHGTRHHLERHAALAREEGVGEVQVLENGQRAALSGGRVTVEDRLASGRVHVFAGRPITEGVLTARARLAEAGVLSVAVVLTGNAPSAVKVSSRGVVAPELEGALHARAEDEVRAALSGSHAREDADVEERARLAARRVATELTGAKPQTLVNLARAS